jgi:hypothetical protein
MATDLVTIATTAALSQFLGPSAKHLGEVALERSKQVGTKAVALLAAVSRKPQPVEPKVLLPLVQAAALETDEALADKWAALLANAADPSVKTVVTVKFVEILRALSTAEAKILQHLNVKQKDYSLNYSLNLDSLAARLDIMEQDFEIAADSLLSTRLCELPPDDFIIDRNGDLIQTTHGKGELRLSSLGKAFLTAVTPPTL